MIVSIPKSEAAASVECKSFLADCFSVALGRGLVMQMDGGCRSVVVAEWREWLSCMYDAWCRWSAFSVPEVMCHVFRFVVDIDDCLFSVRVWWNSETKGINYGVA